MFVVISSAVENPDTIYWKVLLSINYERLEKKTKRQDNYKTKMHACIQYTLAWDVYLNSTQIGRRI